MPDKTTQNECRIIHQIKKKLTDENATITKADKGNSIVILYIDDYNRKIDNFISNNSFTLATRDVTNKLQRDVKTAIETCREVIPREDRWIYKKLNPTIPAIRGLVKIHKDDYPIRPVINWKNAPAYKFAKVLTKKLLRYISLPYTYNFKNTNHLINDLKEIPCNQNLRLASLDIANMYSNIPTGELITIVIKACQNNYIENNLKHDIVKVAKTIVEQNCFQFGGRTYVQSEDLAMGAPTSSTFSEFYLQYLESTKIYDILTNHNIECYFRYVDDILIIYNESKTDIDYILDCFNKLTTKLEFTLERETIRRINFLDITICREQKCFSMDIYRKPTSTKVIIPNDSCHPREHKVAAIRQFHNRMVSYQLAPENMEKEHNTILQILNSNKYDTSTLRKLNTKKGNKHKGDKTKWVKFTYVGRETRAITKVLQNTNVKVTFGTDNTIKKLLTTRHEHTRSKYENSRICQLTCPTYSRKYTGQTGRPFRVRFQENFRDFKYGNGKSRFAAHLLENKHSISPMDNIIETLHTTGKDRMMDILERFDIFRQTKTNNQINDKLTIKPNIIFECIVQGDPHRGLPAAYRHLKQST